MKKWKTNNQTEIFQVLKGKSNVYLVTSRKLNILIDTGNLSSYNELKQNIKSLNLPSDNIDYLILTHSHYDHCQNACRMKEDYNCKIFMSQYESGYTEIGFTVLPKGTFKITNYISSLGNWIGKRRFGYKPFSADTLIDEEIDLSYEGSIIRLINTKGHSIGSISVIVDNEIAIVGDAMLGTFKRSIFPPFADDTKDMIDSWGRLLQTECKLFLPGHGNAIKRDLLQREYMKYNRICL